MKIDLVGPSRRGLALGLNEAAGYGAVAVTALVTGEIAARYGLRPEPFFLGVAVVALGLGLSAAVVRETSHHVAHEAATTTWAAGEELGLAAVLRRTSWGDPSLAAVCQAGLVNNAVDGLAWALLPLLFASEGVSVAGIGVLAALYPAVWCVGQLVTGAWSDRVGRKPLIVAGMLLQGVALGLMAVATGFPLWAVGAVLVGAGTALVYPTLIAAVGDVAHPHWRATAVGVYRLWRDTGYVVGGILGGVVADAFDLRAAVWVVAALSVASAAVVAVRMVPGPRSTATQRTSSMARSGPAHMRNRRPSAIPPAAGASSLPARRGPSGGQRGSKSCNASGGPRDCIHGPRGEEDHMAGMTVRSFESPDEVRSPDKTKVEVVDLDGVKAAQITLQPGWRWSECIKPVAGTDSCQVHHVGVVVSGRIHVVHDDGTEGDAGPGDAYVINPGHDAWVLGDEPLVGFEFDSSAATTYAKPS
jgi:MFS family permease